MLKILTRDNFFCYFPEYLWLSKKVGKHWHRPMVSTCTQLLMTLPEIPNAAEFSLGPTPQLFQILIRDIGKTLLTGSLLWSQCYIFFSSYHWCFLSRLYYKSFIVQSAINSFTISLMLPYQTLLWNFCLFGFKLEFLWVYSLMFWVQCKEPVLRIKTHKRPQSDSLHLSLKR